MTFENFLYLILGVVLAAFCFLLLNVRRLKKVENATRRIRRRYYMRGWRDATDRLVLSLAEIENNI